MDLLFGRQDFASEACQQNTFLLTNGLGGYCSLSAAFSATRGDHALLMEFFQRRDAEGAEHAMAIHMRHSMDVMGLKE